MQHVQHHTDHQSAPAQFANVAGTLCAGAVRPSNSRPRGAHSPLVLEHVEPRPRRCAGHGAAAESGSQLTVNGLKSGENNTPIYRICCRCLATVIMSGRCRGSRCGRRTDRCDRNRTVRPSQSTVPCRLQAVAGSGKRAGVAMSRLPTPCMHSRCRHHAFGQFFLPCRQVVERQIGYVSVGIEVSIFDCRAHGNSDVRP